MDGNGSQSTMARRLFLTRLGANAGLVSATTIAASSNAMAQIAGGAPWHPTRHTQDDWLDNVSGQHRFVFDTTSTDGMASAVRFARNYYTANSDAYGLKDSELTILIIARHKSTPFGYNDAIWAKYGKQLAELGEYVDPKTKQPPTINIYATLGDASNQAGGLDGIIKRGARVAVCQSASRELATSIAKSTGGDTDAILKEIGANLIGNARFVPAGIVAVNRAQERGYSFVYCD
jgi:hypothetical protein